MSERYLQDYSDRQNAVRNAPARCKPENFQSLMDYLFAAVFPDCYFLVMNYYADEGPPLRDIMSREQCFMVDNLLVEALKLAYEDFCTQRVRSWSKVRVVVDRRYFSLVG